jgi:hypothetical protein
MNGMELNKDWNQSIDVVDEVGEAEAIRAGSQPD